MLNRTVVGSFLVSFSLSGLFFYNFGLIYAKQHPSSNNRKLEQKNEKPRPTVPSTTPTPTIRIRKPGGQWIGKVSHYSYNGCLGCNPERRMANGETLDDSKPTIAFNWLPMNTRVLVTNLDNGKSIEAVVTDTGGFNELGRIADLTPVIAAHLETKTNISNVKIEDLE